MIHLNFTRSDLGAIVKMALLIADADGERHQREIDYICAVINRMGVAEEWVPTILVDALSLSVPQAKSYVTQFNSSQKRFACAFIGSVIFIDRKVLQSETNQWFSMSKECGFSAMSLEDAYNIMNQFLS